MLCVSFSVSNLKQLAICVPVNERLMKYLGRTVLRRVDQIQCKNERNYVAPRRRKLLWVLKWNKSLLSSPCGGHSIETSNSHSTWVWKNNKAIFLRFEEALSVLMLNVYIYVRQLSSFRAPTLWFIDLTVATCRLQYTFMSWCQFYHEK